MNAVNLINPETPFERAMRLVTGFPGPALKERLALIVARKWRSEPENLVALTRKEILEGPPWLQRADAEGRIPLRFILAPSSEARMRRFLLHVESALGTLAEPPPRIAEEFVLKYRAMRLRESIHHHSVDELDPMIRSLLRLRAHVARAHREHTEREETIHPPQEVQAPRGCVWRVVPSTGRLGEIGTLLRICTATHRREFADYARALRSKEVVFWALEDAAGAPHILVMVSHPEGVLMEAKGPDNAHVALNLPSVRTLLRKQKLRLPKSSR